MSNLDVLGLKPEKHCIKPMIQIDNERIHRAENVQDILRKV